MWLSWSITPHTKNGAHDKRAKNRVLEHTHSLHSIHATPFAWANTGLCLLAKRTVSRHVMSTQNQPRPPRNARDVRIVHALLIRVAFFDCVFGARANGVQRARVASQFWDATQAHHRVQWPDLITQHRRVVTV